MSTTALGHEDRVHTAPTTDPLASRVPRIFELLFVAACSLVVLVALAPDKILSGSMPLGTDVVGHAVVAWWDSHNLLGFLPGAWSDDAFNGFPVNQLYPWLPTWLAGLLSLALPLGTAMKIVVVAPLVLMPYAAWQAGTWARLPQPLPVMLAAGSLPYLFDTSCASCGGNIYSTVNGEYAFAWGMLFAVLALGAVDRLAQGGRGWFAAPTLVAATAFSHPLPTVWLVIGIGAVAIGREVWARREVARSFGLAALAAALLAAMWWVPFVAYRSWMPTNLLVREGASTTWLFPASSWWEVVVSAVALVGLAYCVRRRAWLVLGFTIASAVAVLAFLRFADGGPFYSIRVLPFWQFGRWMLAAVGFAWVLKMALARLRRMHPREVDPKAAPVAWLAGAVIVIGSTWGFWGVVTPATLTTNGEAQVLGQRFEVSFASAWPSTTFGGFEARSDFSELSAVKDLLAQVGQRAGCGTLMWDSGDLTQDGGATFGDPQVFWQAPIWTNGCVTSSTGVLVDSSATSPAMQLTSSLVSQFPESTLGGRPSYQLDLRQGVDRMRALGIRYYLTQGGEPADLASKTKGLTKVATSGRFVVWLVEDSFRAQGLANYPAVFSPPLSNADWESVANRYFTTDTYSSMPLAQSGLTNWPEASVENLPTPVAAPPTTFNSVTADAGRISFNVEKPGSPVIIRASAFPGWKVSGADGPFRVSPNYMVVVPTSTSVTLVKGRTAIDWIAGASGIFGLALLVGYGLYRALQRREPEVGDTDSGLAAEEPPADDDAAASTGADGVEAPPESGLKDDATDHDEAGAEPTQ